jgi:hypothetical protein
MALQAGVSKATVQRLWTANDIKPHLSRTFKLSKDKQFEAFAKLGGRADFC